MNRNWMLLTGALILGSLFQAGCGRIDMLASLRPAETQVEANEHPDLAKVQGEWTVVEWRTAGGEYTAGAGKLFKVSGRRLSYEFLGTERVFRIELNPRESGEGKESLARLDLHGHPDLDGDGRGDLKSVRKCIYRLDNDRWVLGFGSLHTDVQMKKTEEGEFKLVGTTTSDRPSQFEPEGDFSLIILQRK